MTVKKISQTTQQVICNTFLHQTQDIDGLANFYGVSRRTIIRVLEDHQVDPGIRRRKVKAKPVITQQEPFSFADALREAYDMPPVQQSWLQRTFSKVKAAFNRV